MRSLLKLVPILLLTLLATGCATTYVPVSWGVGEKVQQLSRTEPALSILYDRYDPRRTTLRVNATSFDEVMMPEEVKHHLGAYRTDTKLIYRNLYYQFSDKELGSLMLHEFAHHIWFNYMTKKQREQWQDHLRDNPSPLQQMVRSVYDKGTDYDSEDFAFTVQFPRQVDIEQLAVMNLITLPERDALLKEQLKSSPVRTVEKAQTLPGS